MNLRRYRNRFITDAEPTARASASSFASISRNSSSSSIGRNLSQRYKRRS